MTKLRILAVAYALLAALVTPALLWAADPPASADVAATTTTTGSDAPWISNQAPKTTAAGSTSKAAQAAATPPPRHPADSGQPAPTAAPTARAAGATGVTIKDFEFAPKSITVHVGDTVTWTNDGPTGHSATAQDKSFDTGVLAKGKSGSHTFTKAGTYAYICTPHPFMHATIVVAAAAGNDTGSNPGTGTSSSGTGPSGSTTPAAGGGSSPSSGSGSSGATTGSSSLPNTGWDVGLVALLGFGLLLVGLGLRERAALRA